MTKEDQEALEELRRAIGNPLNALKVYAPFRRLRAYYALHVHKNIVVHLQRSLGKMMLDAMDLQGFFMSIDKRVVNGMVQRIIDRRYDGSNRVILKRLFAKVVTNCPQLTARRRSPASAWEVIPPSKSLFGCDGFHGLAIGNIPSQWSAALVMARVLDILARHGLTESVSYMDDILVFTRERTALLAAIPSIERELRDGLGLRLHPRKRNLQQVRKGWKIAGTKGRGDRLYASDRTIRRMMSKIHWYCKQHDTAAALATVNSYFGLTTNFRAYGFRKEAARQILAEYGRELYFTEGYRSARLRKSFDPRVRLMRGIRIARKHTRRIAA